MKKTSKPENEFSKPKNWASLGLPGLPGAWSAPACLRKHPERDIATGIEANTQLPWPGLGCLMDIDCNKKSYQTDKDIPISFHIHHLNVHQIILAFLSLNIFSAA